MSPKLDSVINIDNNIIDVYKWSIPRPSFSSSGQEDSSDKSQPDSSTSPNQLSIKSKSSTTKLLLCAENLNAHNKYIDRDNDLDTLSVASSNHFTIVNGMGGHKRNKSIKPIQCCCERHQLTVLVISMTIVLFLTIVYCVYYVHRRAIECTNNYA
ncbi:uncharacterized protein LOC112690811 [Sipha flava]|uniref:Uncharacterized protein LOC112690811 n=1 Tax=Sipha flava TaxID=143950 RepID=A0A2S2Q804_9HEMI|nr:uncharacterized protein LOC112690811 [Sipha flava]